MNMSANAPALSQDHLAAIVPQEGDTWTAQFPDPASGADQLVTNLVVPADTIVIYVGGGALPGQGEAAVGSTGGFSADGDAAWLATVSARGRPGALASPPSTGPAGPGSTLSGSLPGGVVFGTPQGGPGGGPNVVFLPDGTASEDIAITLRVPGAMPALVKLRALTGVVTVQVGRGHL